MNTIVTSNGYHTSRSITNGLNDKSSTSSTKRKKLKSRTTQNDIFTEQKKSQKTNCTLSSSIGNIIDSTKNSDRIVNQSSATDSLPVLFLKTNATSTTKKAQQTIDTLSKRDNKKIQLSPSSDTVSSSCAQSPSVILTHHSIYQNHLHHKISPVRTSSQQRIERHISSLRRPHINNEYCDSCGDRYGELISCDTCPATFHLLCANPPLSREDVPSSSYHCENCIAHKRDNLSSSTSVNNNNNNNDTNHQQKSAFSFDPKKATAKLNGGYKQDLFDIKKASSSNNSNSNINQIDFLNLTTNDSLPSPKRKLSTLSNQREHEQNSISLDVKSDAGQSHKSHVFKKRSKKKSVRNTNKRKRVDDNDVMSIKSSSHLSKAVTLMNNHSSSKLNSSVEVLKCLLLATKSDEFKGPAVPYDVNRTNSLHPSSNLSINAPLSSLTTRKLSPINNYVNVNDRNDNCTSSTHIWQKYCFLCRHIKSHSRINCPLVHCNYCPLTYHLDCLNPPLTSLPKQKWMCPNHSEPILDKKLLKHYGQFTCLSENIKLYKKYSNIQPNLIIQDFSQLRKNRKYLTVLNQNKTHLEHIQVSQIPKSIENYYKKIFNDNSQQRKKKFKMNDDEDNKGQTDIIEYEQNNNRYENYNKITTTNVYNTEVWDVIQSIIDDVVKLKSYQLLSIKTDINGMQDNEKQVQELQESTITLNTIDQYLNTLNESNYFHYRSISKPIHVESNGLAALVTAASSLYEEQQQQQQLNQITPMTIKSQHSQIQLSTTASKLRQSTKVITQQKPKTFQLSQHTFYKQYSVSSNPSSSPSTTTTQSDTSLKVVSPPRATPSSSYHTVKSIVHNDQQINNSLTPLQTNTSISSHPLYITPPPFVHSDHVYNKTIIDTQPPSNTIVIDQKQEQSKQQSQQQSVISPYKSIMDFEKFRLAYAALIHTRTHQVLYLNKRNIWFGLSISNDICLTKFNGLLTCPYISDKHACLYYDEKTNVFELLNYSEYGTIVDGLRYGLGDISSDDDDDDDDDAEQIEDQSDKITNSGTNDALSIPLQRCCCQSLSKSHSAWDGAARIDAGTVIQLGCHEFIFYRYVVR